MVVIMFLGIGKGNGFLGLGKKSPAPAPSAPAPMSRPGQSSSLGGSGSLGGGSSGGSSGGSGGSSGGGGSRPIGSAVGGGTIFQNPDGTTYVDKTISPEKSLTLQEVSKSPTETGKSLGTISDNKNVAGTISAAKDQSVGGAFEQIKTIARNEGVKKAILNAPKIILASIRKPNQAERNRQQNVNDLVGTKFGNTYITNQTNEQTDVTIGAPPQMNFQNSTQRKDTLISLVKGGNQDAATAYVQINQDEINNFAKQQEEKNKNLSSSNAADLQRKVYAGQITPEEANTQQQAYNEQLTKDSQEAIDNKISSSQKKLDKALKTGKIVNTAEFIIPAAAIGFGTGAALGLLPEAVQTAAGIGFGAAAGKQVYNLATSPNTSLVDVGSFVVLSGAAVAGGAAGAKFTGGSVENTKLQNALRNSQIVSDNIGVIKESTLTTLDIPPNDLAAIKAQVKGGASVRIVDVKIRAANNADQAIIDKNLPVRDIKFVQVTDSLGNLINRVAVGKVKLEGATGKAFTQDILVKGESRINPEGVIEGTTLTSIGNEKGVMKAILTSEETTGTTQPIPKTRLRLVQTNTGVKLIEAVEAKGKPLTQAELKRLVVEGYGEKGTKQISEQQFQELQMKTRLRVDAIIADANAVVLKEENLVTRGTGISTSVLEKPKVSKSRAVRNIEFPTEENLKVQPDVIQNKIKSPKAELKTARQITIEDLQQLPANVEVGVRESFESAAKELGRTKIRDYALLANPSISEAALRNLLANNSSLANADLVSLYSAQFQSQELSQAQLQQLALKNATIQENAQGSQAAIPNFPFEAPFVAGGFGKDTEAGLRKIYADLNKRIAKAAEYTPSLINAAEEIGVVIDEKTLKKQMDKLNTNVYSGFESRPLIFIKPEPKKKGRSKKKGL